MLPTFFIVGCGRSGTTILRNVLCSHPQVLIPPETSFFFWSRTSQPFRPLNGDECRRLVAEFRMDATSRLRPGHFFRREIALLRTDWQRLFGDFLKSPLNRRLPIHVLEAIVDDWIGRQGKVVTMVGEKTPHHVFRMPVILANLPDAKFIHMVRDPRAVVPSLLEMPWFRGGPWTAARRWRTSVDAARRNAARLSPESFLEVRYEDLVADLPAAARRLANFLGLEFDERMLEPERHGAQFVEPLPWHEMSRTSLTAGVNERRQSGLDPVRRRIIESVAGEMLEEYGYPRMSAASDSTVAKAERLIRTERFLASLSPRDAFHRLLSRISPPR